MNKWQAIRQRHEEMQHDPLLHEIAVHRSVLPEDYQPRAHEVEKWQWLNKIWRVVEMVKAAWERESYLLRAEEWLQHKPGCNWHPEYNEPLYACTCGLDDYLRGEQ